MTSLELQRHADGTIEFSGRIAGDDLRDLHLDGIDMALLRDGAREGNFWGADHLLILEMLFRRLAEQRARARIVDNHRGRRHA